jgi:tricorn protease
VVGYVHIPDMGGAGLSAFIRQFYPQFDKRAIVVDVRDNDGGFVSQMIIERLARKVLAFDQPRHGQTFRYPARAVHAHMVCLIDEHAGSDGDIFPAAFRMKGLGPLIGTRTWGGVVGIRADKLFVDFGLSTQPEYAWWEADHGWSIENVGVEPDITVEITPGDRSAGRDPQLDRAISHLLEQLEKDPMELPKVPDWPVRNGGN